jgi:hypothetical protein
LQLINTELKEWVAPFGNRRVKAFSQLTDAYRSVIRPSSPAIAKASTKCPYYIYFLLEFIDAQNKFVLLLLETIFFSYINSNYICLSHISLVRKIYSLYIFYQQHLFQLNLSFLFFSKCFSLVGRLFISITIAPVNSFFAFFCIFFINY